MATRVLSLIICCYLILLIINTATVTFLAFVTGNDNLELIHFEFYGMMN